MTIDGSGTITGLVSGGLPDASIIQSDLATGVSSTGPAFRAFMGAAQTISGTTFTKLNFNSEVFDTNNNFNTSTYRFTPTVAGYYHVSITTYFSATAQLYLYKNGTAELTGPYVNATGHTVSGIVYLNGSTDYIEAFYYGSAGVTTTNNTSIANQFSAFSLRAA